MTETASRLPVLKAARRDFRPVIALTALFSVAVNGLMFAGPLYMLQVYDRVLTSRSLETLTAISLLGLGAIALTLVLDVIRSRVLVRAGALFDRRLSRPLFEAVLEREARAASPLPGQALRDLDTLRDTLMGTAPAILCDLPWTPLYLVLAFLLHPMIGVAALVALAAVALLAIANEAMTRAPLREAGAAGREAADVAAATFRNTEAVRAMGMGGAFAARYLARHHEALAGQRSASDRAGLVLALSRAVRLAVSSGILGLGAYLVIRNEIGAGAMFAASLLLTRALTPVDQALQHWRALSAAREAGRRIADLLAAIPAEAAPMPLPAPVGDILVEDLAVAPPEAGRTVVAGVSFALRAGSVLALVGPSGAGKSSLLRALAGVWAPARGAVRLDGARLEHYDAAARGRAVGYLPQDVALFAGTVAENIARFETIDAEAVAAAARMAGVHEMILRLPAGYDTPVGPGGAALSGGQRQRIALARALYRMPRLIVLDEPNASLDADGEDALVKAIAAAAAAGSTVIVSSHRPSLLAAAGTVLVLSEGRPRLFGPRAGVLAKLNGEDRRQAA